MKYLIALLLPPLAVLACGKPVQFMLNCFLCLFLWVPGIVHALLVVSSSNADFRQQKLIHALRPETAPKRSALSPLWSVLRMVGGVVFGMVGLLVLALVVAHYRR